MQKITQWKVSAQVCKCQCLIYFSMFSALVYGLLFPSWEISRSESPNSPPDEQPNIDGGQLTTLLDFSSYFQFYSFCFHWPLLKLSQVCHTLITEEYNQGTTQHSRSTWIEIRNSRTTSDQIFSVHGPRGAEMPWFKNVLFWFSALFLIVVLSALIIASINTIRETECGKKCLPGFLLSWKWLPLACRSLAPYDKFCSCSCCGKQVRYFFNLAIR